MAELGQGWRPVLRFHHVQPGQLGTRPAGVVGIQLSLSGSAAVARLLPFWAPRRLIDVALGETSSVWRMVLVGVAYAAALFAASLILMARQVAVRRHPPIGAAP